MCFKPVLNKGEDLEGQMGTRAWLVLPFDICYGHSLESRCSRLVSVARPRNALSEDCRILPDWTSSPFSHFAPLRPLSYLICKTEKGYESSPLVSALI